MYSLLKGGKDKAATIHTANLSSNVLTKIAPPLTQHLASSCKALHGVYSVIPQLSGNYRGEALLKL